MEKRFGAHMLHLDCLGRAKRHFDLRTAEGAQNAAQRLKEAQSLAGLVLVLEGESESLLAGPEETAAFLTGFFDCLKCLMSSKNKAFCLSLLQRVPVPRLEALTGEGILGMFLAAAQEYPSMLFRSVALEPARTYKSVLDLALDTGQPDHSIDLPRPEDLLPSKPPMRRFP